jgi:hypothetical protein
MSFNNGPRIVTSGLVLSLDAADQNSYPGSGTTWTDLSGNNNSGSLVNGPTFSSANGGSIVFDGTNNYVSCGTLGSYGSQMATNGITFEFIFSSTYTAAFKQFGTINTGINTVLGINFNRDENDAYSARKTTLAIRGDGNIYLVGAISTDIYTGAFFIVSAVRQASTNQISFYVNGVLQTTIYGTLTANPTSFSNFENSFTIGASNSRGTVINNLACSIPSFKLYNRALSATEVQQNYNALKSRFGLI